MILLNKYMRNKQLSNNKKIKLKYAYLISTMKIIFSIFLIKLSEDIYMYKLLYPACTKLYQLISGNIIEWRYFLKLRSQSVIFIIGLQTLWRVLIYKSS